jgi:hypothetical protein
MSDDHLSARSSRWARWRDRRRARAQLRREAREHRPPSANDDRLRAEAALTDDDRRRSYGKIFDGL